MPEKGVLIVCLLLFGVAAGAQEISREVLVPLASVSGTGGYDISQTIGEPIVNYVSEGEWALTQGFQQPSCNLPLRPPPQGNGVHVYPNPVVNNLKIEMFGDIGVDYEVTLFGLDGSIYFTNQYECKGKFWRIEIIDVTNFKRGLYFVRVNTSNNAIARLFKIEKM